MEVILEIDSKCNSCDNCRLLCPQKAIYAKDQKYYIDYWSCSLCNICREVCPEDAITLIKDE